MTSTLCGFLRDTGHTRLCKKATLKSIDNGLAKCRAGIVILSEAFFAKRWTQLELNALVSAGRRLIPIWFGVGFERVAQFSPILTDIKAIDSTKGLDYIVTEVMRGFRPGFHQPPFVPTFLVTWDLGSPGTVRDSNILALAEASAAIDQGAAHVFELDFERDVYVNAIVGYDRILASRLHDFDSIYRDMITLAGLRLLKRKLDREASASVVDRWKRLDIAALFEISGGFEDRLSEFIVAFLAKRKSMNRNYDDPENTYLTVTAFLGSAIQHHRFSKWHEDPPDGLQIDCWQGDTYFKVSLDHGEAEHYLSIAGMSRAWFYGIKQVGIRASEFSSETKISRVYPSLLRRLLFNGIDPPHWSDDLFNLDGYLTGLA